MYSMENSPCLVTDMYVATYLAGRPPGDL